MMPCAAPMGGQVRGTIAMSLPATKMDYSCHESALVRRTAEHGAVKKGSDALCLSDHGYDGRENHRAQPV